MIFWETWGTALRQLLWTTRAGVAVTFAITVIPVTGLIGLAIDVGFLTQARTQLNTAADSAALAAAKTAADAFTANQPNYLATGQAAGLQWFASQTGSVVDATFKPPSITVTQSGAVFTSTVSFQGAVTPFIAPLFGFLSFPIGGTARATITTNAYVSVTFLLDNSSSMLIAATQAGVDQLNTLTAAFRPTAAVPSGLGGLNCAFACHWDPAGNDYYGLARKNQIPLRFDVLKTAVASAIGQMISQQVIANQFSVSIFTFDRTLFSVYATSTDLMSGINAAQVFQTSVGPDDGNTYFPAVMNSLALATTKAGDGSSPASPRKALIIVTDGLTDYPPRNIPSSQGPIDPANCTAMKALGYSVYVLYTTYITTSADNRPGDNKLLPFGNIAMLPYLNGTATPTMAGSLQACASAPTNYAEASDPTAINTAMGQMLRSALGNGGRFTK